MSVIQFKGQWKPVEMDGEVIESGDAFKFLSSFEEITDYELADGQGNIIRPKKKNKKEKKKAKTPSKPAKQKAKAGKRKSPTKEADDVSVAEDGGAEDPPDTSEAPPKTKKRRKGQVQESESAGMDAWADCCLQPTLLRNLKALGFAKPTEIQALCLPAAVRDRLDILGAAETGSGKTLAFGLPILNGLLEEGAGAVGGLRALILTPTRELAVQIRAHITAAATGLGVGVSVVIGGLSAQKQERLLKRRPQIVVATPGRLWAFMQATKDSGYLGQLGALRWLVIDETDRMVEKGHFEELQLILDYVRDHSKAKQRQTMVFSATLTYVHPPPKRLDKKQQKQLSPEEKIEELIRFTGLRRERKTVDITRAFGTAAALTEARLNCDGLLEKDAALFYLLRRYPGRCLVFANSIDASRRLHSLLRKLGAAPLLLHARMAQKQRLKSLEKFTGSDSAVLLATDVAARGLDIRGIQHVIHYHVPRTAEVYVHRSGRTARASAEGLSVLLVDPNDATFYRRICRNLTRVDLPVFPADPVMMESTKELVRLATEIESAEHRLNRAQSRETWFRQTAEAADLLLDDDDLEANVVRSNAERDQLRATVRRLDARLKAMLREPLRRSATQAATRYPTLASANAAPKLHDLADPIASAKAAQELADVKPPKVAGRLKVKLGKKKSKAKPRKKKRH